MTVFFAFWAALADESMQISSGTLVQIEIALIGALASAILRLLWLIYTRLTIVDTTLRGPELDSQEGLVFRVTQWETAYQVSERLALRSRAEYLSWRRRVEQGLHEVNPNFQLTPEHVLIDLITGEDPRE